MARYIDADKLIEHLKDEIKACEPVFGGRANGRSVAYGTKLGLKSAISFAETLATVDVAPKSEVERLQAEVDRLLELVGTIPPDRVEFVSRIEINAIKENLAREIFEEIDKTVFADMDFFKELKKKYTEDKII